MIRGVFFFDCYVGQMFDIIFIHAPWGNSRLLRPGLNQNTYMQIYTDKRYIEIKTKNIFYIKAIHHIDKCHTKFLYFLGGRDRLNINPLQVLIREGDHAELRINFSNFLQPLIARATWLQRVQVCRLYQYCLDIL